MDIFTGIIAEGLFYHLIQLPGALIRWIFSDRKRTFNEIWKEDQTYKNGFIGFSLFLGGLFIYGLHINFG